MTLASLRTAAAVAAEHGAADVAIVAVEFVGDPDYPLPAEESAGANRYQQLCPVIGSHKPQCCCARKKFRTSLHSSAFLRHSLAFPYPSVVSSFFTCEFKNQREFDN